MHYDIRTRGKVEYYVEEADILNRCASGSLDEEAMLLKPGGGGEWISILEIPEFAAAIRMGPAERKRHDAEHNPASTDLLYTQFNNKVLGPYTVAQVRGLWNRGQIPANAVFKHPDYEEWFPCLSLFRGGASEAGGSAINDRWEYYCLTLTIKGARSGVLSGVMGKSVADSSFSRLAKLGQEGWELVAIVSATHGFMFGGFGSIGTDAAVAILKRRAIRPPANGVSSQPPIPE